MNDHDKIRTQLAAYCGGDLDESERSRIEAHLAGCAGCRADLSDLQTTLQLIKTTPQVEPPPWLATRVMARVREQQREKRSWLQRLFLPLHVKLPFEFAALLLVCISGYYMARTMETKLPQPGVTREETVLAPPQTNTHSDAGTPAAATPATPATAAPAPSSAGTRRKNDIKSETVVPLQPPAAKMIEQQTAPQRPAFLPPPAQIQSLGASSNSLKEERAVSAKPQAESAPAPAPVTLPGERAAKHAKKAKSAASGEAARYDSAGAAGSQESYASAPVLSGATARIHIKFSTPTGSPAALREMIIRSGGSLIEEPSGKPDRIKVRLPSSRLQELLTRMERLGEISARPQQPDTSAVIVIEIDW